MASLGLLVVSCDSYKDKEANPDDLDAPYLAALREAGIDRLSIGVQSFDATACG